MNAEAETSQLLKDVIQALEGGHKARARELVARVLGLDAQNEQAWYYLSRTMTTASGAAWCLNRVLSINPRHVEARQLLRDMKEPTGSLTPQGHAPKAESVELVQLDGQQRSPEAVDRHRAEEVAGRTNRIGRLLDDQALRLKALEGRPDDRDAQLSGIQREADAPDSLNDADVQAALETQEALAREVDGLLTDIVHAARQLDAVQNRLSHTERVTDALEARVGSLEGELAPLDSTLRNLRTELGRLDARSAHMERNIASLERQVAVLRRPRTLAPLARPRWAVLPILVVVLGLILISIGAVEAYPYVVSRLAPGLLGGRAHAGAGSVSAEPLESRASQPLVDGTSPLGGAAVSTGVPSSEIDSVIVVHTGATITPTQAPPTPMPPTPVPPTPVPPPPVPPTPVPTPVPAIPTRLVVARIGVDAPVVPVSWRSANELGQAEGAWEVPDGGAVGWHNNSVGLGVPGNTVFSGHNTTGGEVFRNLFTVVMGDQIIVYSDARAFTYVVSEVLILPELGQPREVRERNASYMLPTEDERLTLVTCHPYGSLRNRLIVIARPQ